jgi:membrane protease YdiL (CAAX protease family)
MLNPNRLSVFTLIFQPVFFIIASVIGSLNDDVNGFNGMQAAAAIPLFIIVFVSLFVWKILKYRFIAGNQLKRVKFANVSLILICLLALVTNIILIGSTFTANH